jgi:hypothetical protein
MSLTTDQIAENWKQFRQSVDDWFPVRARELHNMYDVFEDRILVMPASSVNHYHNAFEGGYVDHILRVMGCAQKLYTTWGEMGADLSGFTIEELMFAAMHHDLGKAGFPHEGGEVYIPNSSEWHRKNQGKIYTHNPNIPFTMVPDLSLWTLQYFKIPVTWYEYQGIRVHDGLYDEANKPYFISRTPESKLRTNLPLILHHADHMAARIEYESWKNNTVMPTVTKQSNKGPAPTINANKLFEDLFGS